MTRRTLSRCFNGAGMPAHPAITMLLVCRTKAVFSNDASSSASPRNAPKYTRVQKSVKPFSGMNFKSPP